MDMNVSTINPFITFNQYVKEISENNPLMVFATVGILALYLLVFRFAGSRIKTKVGTIASGDSGVKYKPSKTNNRIVYVLDLFLWGILLYLIFINGFELLLSLDIKTKVKNLISPHPEVTVTVESDKLQKSDPPEKEVFHVHGNHYTYDDAEAFCKAYNGELASYDQVKNAHEHGAEWCSYGWSKDQMALYPTSKETYDKLQKIKGHEHDCGRPGINGGHIANPNARFGVNCYGYKPEISPAESDYMASNALYPKSERDKALDDKIEFYRQEIPNILLSPFNKTSWKKV